MDTGGWGGGRALPDASPEAARGFESSRDYPTGPPDEDPGARPGCARVVVGLVLVCVGIVLVLFLLGLLHVFG